MGSSSSTSCEGHGSPLSCEQLEGLESLGSKDIVVQDVGTDVSTPAPGRRLVNDHYTRNYNKCYDFIESVQLVILEPARQVVPPKDKSKMSKSKKCSAKGKASTIS